MVGEAVQQRAGQALRSEHPGPLVKWEVGGHQDGAPLAALAEDLEEQFCPGGGQGDKAQLIDGQQVEQPSFVPGPQRSALPRFHRRDAPSEVPQQVYFAAPAMLDRRACRMVEDSAALAVNSPVSSHRL